MPRHFIEIHERNALRQYVEAREALRTYCLSLISSNIGIAEANRVKRLEDGVEVARRRFQRLHRAAQRANGLKPIDLHI